MNSPQTLNPTSIGYLNGYRPFVPSSGTTSGRSIFVKESLYNDLKSLEQMAQIPGSDSYHALELMRSIDSLRAQAVPVNSFKKNSKNSPHCLVGSSFEIYFETNPSYLDQYQTVTVITDLKIKTSDQKNKKRAALWNVVYKDGRKKEWTQKGQDPLNSVSIPNRGDKPSNPIQVGINGHCSGFDRAANYMPSHISRGNKTIEKRLQENGYQLLYVPYGSSVKAGWDFVRTLGNHLEDSNTNEAAAILSDYMYEAHQKNLHIEWTAHAGGTKVLTKAMRMLAQRSVNVDGKQAVYIADATSSALSADRARRSVGMNVSDNDWKYSNPKSLNAAQWIGGKDFGTAGMACAVTALGYDFSVENIFRVGTQAISDNKALSAGIASASTMATTGFMPLATQFLQNPGIWSYATAGGVSLYALLSQVPALNQKRGSNPLANATENTIKGIKNSFTNNG
ncbi:MAG: hypothetical protein CMH98_07100 [Oceanospirillaceae bacterium]|nr:hypothetical protein [Oceanospirillaceae bacterium]